MNKSHEVEDVNKIYIKKNYLRSEITGALK